ncbi:MAG: class B sortase [Christensenella sp.]
MKYAESDDMVRKITEESPDENAGYETTHTRQAAKKKLNVVIMWIVIAAAAAVAVFALVNILGISSEDMASTKVYSELRKVAAGAAAEESAADPYDRKIDFDALRAVNEEIAAWIYIPNTSIDYPVLKGEDNDYYISHNAEKEKNRAGAIFIDYTNAPDFTDSNTLIYGHRMNDGSMFADLHKYEDEKFFKENDKVYVYLADGSVRVYKVFGAGVVDEYDEAYTTNFADTAAFGKYLTKMKNRSAASVNMETTDNDKIITLSTCVQGQDTNRYIVQAMAELQE